MKYIKYSSAFLVILTLFSCGIFESEPDKIIGAVLNVSDSEEVAKAEQLLKNRLEQSGVRATMVRESENNIRVTIETNEEPSVIKQLLTASTALEFYEVIPNQEGAEELYDALQQNDSLAEIFTSIFSLNTHYGGPVVGYTNLADTASSQAFLNTYFPKRSRQYAAKQQVWMWGIADKEGMVPLYLLKTDKSGAPVMEGNLVELASQVNDQVGRPAIALQMNPEASIQWANLTERAYKEAFQIAMVVNGEVYSAPGVVSGPITGGRSEITGDFTEVEAQDLARMLELGYLPEMELLSFDVQPIN